jgi:hypothetical protein
MKYYGKGKIEFTSDEHKLFDSDVVLLTSLSMFKSGQSLIGLNSGLRIGTKEDVDDRYIDRTIFVGKLLGHEYPMTQEAFDEMVEIVEKSIYNFQDFIDSYQEERDLIHAAFPALSHQN